MTRMTYLYQALASARKTVEDLERAIEAETVSPTESAMPFTNSGSNGNYTREDYYNWVEENDR